ncbi:MAG: sensor histidine kinase [Nitrospirales bacterium]|nr:ATP-binding protein [Nitrospirales bacterium]
MMNLHVDAVDDHTGIVPSVLRVLAVNFQKTDLDSTFQLFLDSPGSSLSIDWVVSTVPLHETEKSQGYDLALIAQSSPPISWSEAVVFKQATDAGFVILLEADMSEDVALSRAPSTVGIWRIASHWLPMVLPWVIEQCLERKRLLMEQARSDSQLRDAEYRFEMANVASTVLHNVGNVLNSVNVTGKVLEDLVTQSSVPLIHRMSNLLKEHDEDWMTFLSEDPKGKKILPFLKKIGEPLVGEQQALLKEIQSLQRHLSHVRHIILSHQAMARDHGWVEPVAIEELVAQAIELSFEPRDCSWVTIRREFCQVPRVLVDKHQVLQILVNLFRNAKQAMQQYVQPMHTFTLSIRRQAAAPHHKVEVIVQDTGVGIAPEHVNRMFTRGFTTKKEGNGIGLHSSARTLEKLGGSLSVFSAGTGLGATFTMVVPIAEEAEVS